MGLFNIGALAGSVVSILEHVGKILIGVILFVVFTSILIKVLPNDPFRPAIQNFANTIRPYAAMINVFIPVKFVASSGLFVVCAKYFMWIYKKLYSLLLDKSGDDLVDL